MPVVGVYLKDFPALPSAVADDNIIPIAVAGNQISYKTTVSGIITDARITSKLLTGLSVTGGAVVSTDSILQAFGKVQNQLNSKQGTITLTTTGTSGAATLIGSALNIPNYTLSGLGGVPTSRTLTINGTTQDLSADRTFSVGTVTSVGLTMPSAFSVASSPINSSGTIAVTGAGLASQYIRGDGQLADFPTGGGGGGSSVSYYLNGSVNQGTFVGNTYYEMNKTPVLGAGTDFTIAADGYISQFITDANDPNSLLIPAGNWNFETYFSASSGGGTPSFYVELYKYNGTAFTLIASNSAAPELISFGTSIQPYFSALAVPETVLLATDRLAIRIYVTHSGKTITLHTENSHLCQVITTFTTGLQSLNGLSKQAQFFAVGTSGTDFAISSSVDTHTFNLPSASPTARGLITTGTQTIAGAKTWTGFQSVTGQLFVSGTSGQRFNSSSVNGTAISGQDSGSGIGGSFSSTSGNAIGVSGGGRGIYIFGSFANEALYLRNAGLGNAMAIADTAGNETFTVTNTGVTTLTNTLQASSLIKTGGTSAQILAANGSVITAGTNITISGGVISASGGGGGSGTVTSVSALTLGTSGTDLSSSVANPNTTPVITLNVPTASATNRGALSSADWTTFNGKQDIITLTTTGTSGAATLISNTLNIPDYGTALSGYLPLTGGTLSTTNITETLRITNAGTGYALYVQSNSYFQGDVTFQNGFKSATNTFTLPAASGTLALTSDLSGYLPLSGGTLTGALNGTSASFSSTASASAFIPTSSSIPTNGMYLGAANTLNFATNSGSRMTIGTTGSVTMVSTLSLGNYLTITNANTFIYGGTTVGSIQYGNSTSSTHLKTYGATHATLANTIELTTNSVPRLTISATGVATFAAGITTSSTNTFNGTGVRAIDATSTGVQFASQAATHSVIFGDKNSRLFSLFTPSGAATMSIRNHNTSTDMLTFVAAGDATFASTASATAFIPTASSIPTNGMYLSGTNTLDFATNSTNRLSISSAGAATFTASITPLILKSTSATTMYTEYYYNTSTLSGYIGSGSGILSGANNSDFIIRSEADFVVATGGNNRRLTITSGGNVLIGVSSGTSLLEVKQPTLAIGSIFQAWAPGVSGANFRVISTSGQPYMQYDFNNGNVVIGNLGTGTVQATAGVLSVISDSKAKDKRGLFDGSALNAISKIEKPQYWNYNSKSNLGENTYGIKQFGLFADDIHEILGEEFAPTQTKSVYNEETKETRIEPILIDGSPSYNMSDRALLSLAIQAIQELKAEIDILKNN